MKITVIGSGYVGLVTATCLADLGHSVMAVDVDKEKVDALNKGIVPIYELELEPLVKTNLDACRLHFSLPTPSAVDYGEIVFIAVGTPTKENGDPDLQYVENAATLIGKNMMSHKVVIVKSTVPPGTCAQVNIIIHKQLISRHLDLTHDMVSNPEFLKEGTAVKDFMKPDRIICGTEGSNRSKVDAVIRELYKGLMTPIVFMGIKEAEFTKYVSNAMLATRVSFMNEMAGLASDLGVDIEAVRKGVGLDSRIGPAFLKPGVGYGGSCFPKDVSALINMGIPYGKRMQLMKSVHNVNESQKMILVSKVVERFGHYIMGMKIAVWGLAFKPGTDDVREAPSLTIIRSLLRLGANVCAYDPIAMNNAREALGPQTGLTYADTAMNALKECSALLIVTEWPGFGDLDLNIFSGKVIFDGRNVYNPQLMELAQIEYWSIGRPAINTYMDD